MNPIPRYSSTQYQTTNYGLAGLCETHMDPAGFVRSSAKIHTEQMHLRTEGDMIATCMGWLNDVKAGGATAFIETNEEVLFEPRKGSMGFWIDTKANTVVLKIYPWRMSSI